MRSYWLKEYKVYPFRLTSLERNFYLQFTRSVILILIPATQSYSTNELFQSSLGVLLLIPSDVFQKKKKIQKEIYGERLQEKKTTKRRFNPFWDTSKYFLYKILIHRANWINISLMLCRKLLTIFSFSTWWLFQSHPKNAGPFTILLLFFSSTFAFENKSGWRGRDHFKRLTLDLNFIYMHGYAT